MKKQLINEAFRLQQLAGIQPINSLNEEHKFYSRSYVSQKYGDRAKEIEHNIEDENPNVWDMYTSLETPEEVDDFVSGFLNEKLDAVRHEDADIDNDGDVDKTDKYIHKRRKAIGKSMNEGDHEVSMAQNSLKAIISSASLLMNKLGNTERNIPGWIQDHITNAENYINGVN